MNDNTQFIDPSKKSLYGKEGGQFWIGKIVAYADQEDQLDDGFGWRYKVRILGDNSDTDEVEDSYLTYATVLLPTTAGTGAAYKLRSVRLSQGDMVFGVRGGGTAAPKFIIGAFPRTTKTINHKDERGNPTYGKTGKFDTPKGFYGSLKENSTLSGEFNEQIGPKTPSTDPVGPKNYSKAEKKEPSVKAKELGVIAGGDENVNVEEKLTPKKIFLSLKDYAQNLLKGKDAVNSKENLDRITDEVIEKEDRTQEDIEIARTAIKVSKEQNLIEETVAKEKENKINKLEVGKKIYIVRGTKLRFDSRDEAARWILNYIETEKKPEYEKSVNSQRGVDIDTQNDYEKWLKIFGQYVKSVQEDRQSITNDEIKRINDLYVDFKDTSPYGFGN